MDGPSIAPVSGAKFPGIARHPGALSFGYFSLGKQRKVTRLRAETRIENKPPR
jgi:hypothetical protein